MDEFHRVEEMLSTLEQSTLMVRCSERNSAFKVASSGLCTPYLPSQASSASVQSSKFPTRFFRRCAADGLYRQLGLL